MAKLYASNSQLVKLLIVLKTLQDEYVSKSCEKIILILSFYKSTPDELEFHSMFTKNTVHKSIKFLILMDYITTPDKGKIKIYNLTEKGVNKANNLMEIIKANT